MKRFLTVFLAALMILLVGCSKTPAPIEDKPTTTQPTTLSQQEIAEKKYYDSIPKMSKENQEIYDKYIEPYFQAYLFEYPWNEQDHSKIKCLVEIYIATYGYDDFWKNYPKNDNYEHILDYEDMKKKVQSVMAISDNEFKDIMSEYYNKETKQYLYHGGLGGPYVVYYITDVKTENNIMTIYIDQYHDHLVDEKSYKFDQNGNVYAVPRSKITVKIKLEDNGEFKFLSNVIKDV